MKKIIYAILILSLLHTQSFLFSKKEKERYSILFKDVIRNFSLRNTCQKDTSANSSLRKKVKKKKTGKAILVNWSLILADSIEYWAKYSAWIEDWQFKLTWEDQKRRFFTTEAIKFDSNPFRTNWTHALSGAAFYNNARYYRLNILESLLFEFSSSLSWEYFSEWREVISINDVLFSGVAGLPIGEPIYQIGKYILRGDGLINKIAGYLMNPIFALNDLIGSKKWRRNFSDQYYDHPESYFDFGTESSRSSNPNTSNLALTHFGIGTSFLNIPNFSNTSANESSEKLKGTFYSRLSLDISFSSKDVEEYRFETEAMIFGTSKKHLSNKTGDKVKGYKYYIGASTAFELFKKKAIAEYDKGEFHYDFNNDENPEQPTLFTDKFAIINIIGPSFNLSLISGKFKTDINIGGWFDFALVNSYALNEYSNYFDFGENYQKTTLTHYGYYYALGYTLKGEMRLSYGNLGISGLIKSQKYSSIQGLDRFQNKIQDDSKVQDSRTIGRLNFIYRIPQSPFSFITSFEAIYRSGTYKGIIHSDTEQRIYSQIRLSF